MAYKVFLSPSNQDANTWAVGNTNEQEQAEKFADKLQKLLENSGVIVVRADDVKPEKRISKAAGCNLYIPLHTNGFDGSVRGCRLFIYDKKTGYELAKKNAASMAAVGKEVEKLGMSPNVRYYKDFANWFELTNASNLEIPAFYSESIFHDNKEDCNWYFENVNRLAEAYAKGICAYFGIKYGGGAAPSEDIYRVQVGAFKKYQYADAMRAKLAADGYEAFIIKVGDIYRVQVGAFKNRAYAENLMAELKSKGFQAFITGAKKTVDQLAKEVIRGEWGSGAERKERLTASGYDYSAVQARVNELMK